MFIVDAHLDIAYNATHGREVLRLAAEQKPDPDDIPTVGLPDLRQGNVRLICATIFCSPAIGDKPGYVTPDEANAAGMKQLNWYQQQVQAGEFELVTTPAQLPPLSSPATRAIPAILLLEGADALRGPEDVIQWHAAGLRIVGLAWRRTRLAGGTGAPGPLTEEGITLVRELDRFGIIHDTSHLAEESFWQLLDLTPGPVMASHSNSRSIVPSDRQLSDAMARALFARGGVIGINFFDKFLLPPDDYGHRRATLTDVTRHIRDFCDLAGDAQHVGLGTDMDGGLGRDQIPAEIRTSADLPRVADALSTAGFGDNEVRGIMGENWWEFFGRSL